MIFFNNQSKLRGSVVVVFLVCEYTRDPNILQPKTHCYYFHLTSVIRCQFSHCCSHSVLRTERSNSLKRLRSESPTSLPSAIPSSRSREKVGMEDTSEPLLYDAYAAASDRSDIAINNRYTAHQFLLCMHA